MLQQRDNLYISEGLHPPHLLLQNNTRPEPIMLAVGIILRIIGHKFGENNEDFHKHNKGVIGKLIMAECTKISYQILN